MDIAIVLLVTCIYCGFCAVCAAICDYEPKRNKKAKAAGNCTDDAKPLTYIERRNRKRA